MQSSNSTAHVSPFDAIRREDENGNEYWSGRDLARLLGYKDWRNFIKAVKKAIEACEKSGREPSVDFVETNEIVKAGATSKPREDYNLSRYACYLVIENADPTKPIVALGQTYFAIQTRKQELAEELANLTEDQKRIIYRNELAIFNRQLAETAAVVAGIIEPIDFAIFQDDGYRGLYHGETARAIGIRKGILEGDHILEWMGSEELGANIFRATQTDAKIKRENINTKEGANRAHYETGKRVRQFIIDGGGNPPEQMPTPTESVKELEKKERKRLKGKES